MKTGSSSGVVREQIPFKLLSKTFGKVFEKRVIGKENERERLLVVFSYLYHFGSRLVDVYNPFSLLNVFFHVHSGLLVP